MPLPTKQRWLALACAAAILVAALWTVGTFSGDHAGPNTAPVQQNTAVVSNAPTETPPTEPEELPCPSDWQPFALTGVPLTFCSPSSYGEAMEIGDANETHVTFQSEELFEVTFLTQNGAQVEGDAPELVDFACLTHETAQTAKNCFDPSNRVGDIDMQTLPDGEKMFVAHVEVPVLGGDDRYIDSLFVLVPTIVGTDWHLQISATNDELEAAKAFPFYVQPAR